MINETSGVSSTKTKRQKRQFSGLGRGLAALLESRASSSDDSGNNSLSGYIAALDVDSVSPNPAQPRIHIDTEALMGLADSIREHGVIEPLIVTQVEGDITNYRIVAGERRWRAAKLAKLKHIPVVVKELTDQEMLEMAIIENIQREDLNPLEEGRAISELFTKYRVKLEDLAKKLGRDVSTLSNKMRLLKLPDQVQSGLLAGEITESHAMQLLTLKNRDGILAAYNIILKKRLSVPATSDLVRKINFANREVLPQKGKKSVYVFDDHLQKIQERLETKLGEGFRIIKKKVGGKITIPFANDADLEKISDFLLKEKFAKIEKKRKN